MITTHVLDVSIGKPATGVTVTLDYFAEAYAWRELGRDITNADGRAGNLLPKDAVTEPGKYKLTFDTATYFTAREVNVFYPEVVVMFVVHDPEQHYHVPLLLSPFGFTTYRGS